MSDIVLPVLTPDCKVDTQMTSMHTLDDSFVTPTSTNKALVQMTASEVPSSTHDRLLRNLILRALQPRPIVGLLALCLAACCVFFSLAILVTSNSQPIDTWTVQPTAYLAIAAAIANSAIGFAYAQATVVAWWYRASKGATIRNLERQWEASISVTYVFLRIRDLSLVGIAAILVTIFIADGALLQRASSVGLAAQSDLISLNFSLAPEVPTGFSGNWQWTGLDQSPAAVSTGQDWMARMPITLPVSPRCKGSFLGRVTGPGVLKTNCTSNTWSITQNMFWNPNATWGSASKSLYNTVNDIARDSYPVLYIGISPHARNSGVFEYESEAAALSTGLMEIVNLSGTYTEILCWLLPAIFEYAVQFDDGGLVNLKQGPDSKTAFLALANNTLAFDRAGDLSRKTPSTIDFLTQYLGIFSGSFTTACTEIETNSSGRMIDYNTMTAQALKYYRWLDPLDIAFSDPTDDIVDSMNEMMFRAAAATSTWTNVTSLIDAGLSVSQSTMANQTITRDIFRSDFRWYAAATSLEIIVVLAVLPLFWGWWTLPKHLNLSPFSIGLVFNAPLLRAVNPVDEAAGVVKQLGDLHVRFGEVVEEKSGARSPGTDISSHGRIGIDESRKVVRL